MPTLEVSVTLPPSQKVVELPAVIVGCVGKAFTVTSVFADATLSHPAALVTFTQKLPAVLTVILAVVAPVDHS